MLPFINKSRSSSDAIQSYPCTRCHRIRFRSSAQLDTHISSCKQYHCVTCTKTYHSEETFIKHLRTNCPPNRFKCDQCYKTYSRKSDRDKHMKGCAKAYSRKCSTCHCVFLTEKQFESHMPACAEKQDTLTTGEGNAQ